MPSTYTSLCYHVIFSTKNRAPIITPELKADLHAYLGGTINGLGGQVLEVGGVCDHVHLLFRLGPTGCLADLVRELKKASSMWAHRERGVPEFSWQQGYAAFSVSPTLCAVVRQYIQNQETHHAKWDFVEELREVLRLAMVQYDERYLE